MKWRLNLLLIMALKYTLLLKALLSLSRDLAGKTDGFLIWWQGRLYCAELIPESSEIMSENSPWLHFVVRDNLLIMCLLCQQCWFFIIFFLYLCHPFLCAVLALYLLLPPHFFPPSSHSFCIPQLTNPVIKSNPCWKLQYNQRATKSPKVA